MKRILLVLLVLVALVSTQVYVEQHSLNDLARSITEQELEANVLIWTMQDSDMSREISTLGSGALVYRDEWVYYILSAYHVIEGIDENDLYFLNTNPAFLNATLFERKASRMSLIAYDETKDLVLLKFESEDDLSVFPLAENQGKRNDPIVVISNPAGRYDVVSVGKIKSNRTQVVTYEDGTVQENLMRHSAKIQPGSSGSAVLNRNHELIGINVATNLVRISIADKPINLNGYFMPLDQVLSFLRTTEIKKHID